MKTNSNNVRAEAVRYSSNIRTILNLVTTQSGIKYGEGIRFHKSGRDVNADLFGAFNSRSSGFKGVYIDAGEKAEQLADAIKNGNNVVSETKEVFGSDKNQTALRKVDDNKIKIKVYTYYPDSDGSGWWAKAKEVEMTKQEAEKKYGKAPEWNEAWKEWNINLEGND